ncbi:phospholipid carrier-dependent glycosyltransferase [Erythrobacter sp. W53]|uniref:phospholipid carrier-dependent glycosyltransferase n=1 Tax=Erythrobacter sp. W53 TaxID=3425947 RepID=UPI003D76934B
MDDADPIVWIALITVLFWLLTLVRLGIPAEPYFDEVHYLPAARDFLAMGIFSNREHPLLGKELLAAAIWLFGDNPWGWRILPTFMGALTLFAAMRTMWHGSRSAFATIAFGLLLVSGFHLFVHARIAMLDIFFASFLTVAGWQFSAAVRRPERGRHHLIGTGLAIGLALASKWNAIPFAPLPGLAFFAYRLRAGRRRLVLSTRGAPVPGVSLLEAALWLGVLPLLIYALTFAPGFFFAQQPMSGLIEHHMLMLDLQTQVLQEHPYQSTWPQWLMNSRSIWFIYEPVEGVQRGIVLLGNPLTMLLGLPALLWCAWRAVRHRCPAAIGIVTLYVAGVGFWIIAAKPVQFYYHYFFPSIALLAALTLALDDIWRSGRKALAIVPILASLALFAYFFPILSAAPLEDASAFTKWMWLDSWI